MMILFAFFLSACGVETVSEPDSTDPESNNESLEEQVEIDEVEADLEGDEQDVVTLYMNGSEFSVILEGSTIAEDVIERLPGRFTMTDLNENEKYYTFPQSVATDAVNIHNIEAGDVMLYGNQTLVIFYKSFSTNYSYTKIGHIENVAGLEEALGTGDVEVEVLN
ncbi:cyclophilin-like fold protein [Alkalibacterium putridalgicola]|uniref:cyclophilin-like fold protein n=1 Tax=Alkalibacterium putridalgicola TaxID=426703 RepID=UPI0034CDFA95